MSNSVINFYSKLDNNNNKLFYPITWKNHHIRIQFAKPPTGDQTEAHTARVPAPPVHGGSTQLIPQQTAKQPQVFQYVKYISLMNKL